VIFLVVGPTVTSEPGGQIYHKPIPYGPKMNESLLYPHEAKSVEERNNIIEAVKNGSVLAWQHFNVQGDHDFSDDYLKDAIEFSIEDLLQLKVA
jgi:hypothetical protein